MSLTGSWEEAPGGTLFLFADTALGWASRQYFTDDELTALRERYEGLREDATGLRDDFLAARIAEIPETDHGYRSLQP